MSVRTTADEKRDAAKDNIENAIKNLSEIVVDKVWGYDDFTKEYKKELLMATLKLIEIRDCL